MKRAGIKLVDRQLACMPISSPEGQDYLKAMAAAANFAFCNRRAGWGSARLLPNHSAGARFGMPAQLCVPALRAPAAC